MILEHVLLTITGAGTVGTMVGTIIDLTVSAVRGGELGHRPAGWQIDLLPDRSPHAWARGDSQMAAGESEWLAAGVRAGRHENPHSISLNA